MGRFHWNLSLLISPGQQLSSTRVPLELGRVTLLGLLWTFFPILKSNIQYPGCVGWKAWSTPQLKAGMQAISILQSTLPILRWRCTIDIGTLYQYHFIIILKKSRPLHYDILRGIHASMIHRINAIIEWHWSHRKGIEVRACTSQKIRSKGRKSLQRAQ